MDPPSIRRSHSRRCPILVMETDHAPPVIIDPRSWAYWNSKMGRYPPPPQPVRRFASSAYMEQRIPMQRSQSSNSVPAPELSADERCAEARPDLQKIRWQQPSTSDLEE